MTPAPVTPATPRVARRLGLLALLWGAIVLYLTTIPFDFSADHATMAQGWREFRVSIYFLRHVHPPAWSDVFANVAMFIPWATLLAARTRVRGGTQGAAAAAAIGSAALFSLGIEFLQIFARSRYASAWDISLNVTGAAAGFLLGWYGPSRWHRMSPALSASLSARPVRALALTTAGLFWIASLAPFYLRLDAESLYRAVRLARVVPFGDTLGHQTLMEDPLSWGADWVAALLLGGVFALAWREARARSWIRVVGPGLAVALLSFGIEACKLTIAGRRSDLTVTLIFLIGGTMGSAIVSAFPARPARDWGGPAIAAWAVAAILTALAPDLHWPDRADLARIVWVPFMPHFRRMGLMAISNLTILLLLFVPLGALLALRRPRMPLRRAVMAGGIVGAFLEALQLFSHDRPADSTGVVMAAFGTGLGFVVWRMAARRATPGLEAEHGRLR